MVFEYRSQWAALSCLSGAELYPFTSALISVTALTPLHLQNTRDHAKHAFGSCLWLLWLMTNLFHNCAKLVHVWNVVIRQPADSMEKKVRVVFTIRFLWKSVTSSALGGRPAVTVTRHMLDKLISFPAVGIFSGRAVHPHPWQKYNRCLWSWELQRVDMARGKLSCW